MTELEPLDARSALQMWATHRKARRVLSIEILVVLVPARMLDQRQRRRGVIPLGLRCVAAWAMSDRGTNRTYWHRCRRDAQQGQDWCWSHAGGTRQGGRA